MSDPEQQQAPSPSGVAHRFSAGVAGRLQAWRARSRLLPAEAAAWVADRRSRRGRAFLDAAALRSRRRSETAFVFGSGSSLNDVSAAAWAEISAFDTIAFNYFTRQRFVRVDLHLVGELAIADDLNPAAWRPAVAEYAREIEQNPYYAGTCIGLQEGWRAYQSNRLLASDALARDRPVFRYRRIGRGSDLPPSSGLDLVLGAGTVVSCVNLAFVLGARTIVVAGVDLYDTRYFWLDRDEPRDWMLEARRLGVDHPHPTARSVVANLGRWRQWFAGRGVELQVHNPRSLLASVLPVYRGPGEFGS